MIADAGIIRVVVSWQALPFIDQVSHASRLMNI